ncbi:glutathione S-transferase family protein [Reinekea blandensis]|uniref:glutathione transferase n=1 Tax=Reinekea blandensis MED297 TaxID=314283 RepID=A4BD48_9GAMM|nr:glutathione S-transferase [Reinekea blandensis]EAR09792.1 Glutathione S-transferase-like protein [Reinekea sp. MED297] [Reinekea blandensis MED297]
MIVLHHLNNSRSQRILWLLEELGLDYELKVYQRNSKTQLAPDELKAVHPLGKSPVLTDGDQTIAESGLIIDYLIQTYAPQWQPEAGTTAWYDNQYWLHFAEGSLMPPLLLTLVFDTIRKSRMPFIAKPIARAIADRVTKQFVSPDIERLLNFINAQLEGRDWFIADQPCGADFQMSFPLEAARARGLVTDAQHPNILRFLNQVAQREAYQRALQQGGRYAYALKKTA